MTEKSRQSHNDLGQARIERAAALGHALADELDRALGGAAPVVGLAVMCLLAGGHLLLEDVPGMGKTTLARALAAAVRARATRVQFTSDLLPSDLTGVSVYDPSTRDFSFHPGPLFSDVVIADEVNRANPKAQAALLEAMEEGRVSVDGVTYELPDPYFVVATENPVEMEGTYPLPEAQLDRFMVRASVGYPDAATERRLLMGASGTDPAAGVRPVCGMADVRARFASWRPASTWATRWAPTPSPCSTPRGARPRYASGRRSARASRCSP